MDIVLIIHTFFEFTLYVNYENSKNVLFFVSADCMSCNFVFVKELLNSFVYEYLYLAYLKFLCN